MAAPVDSTRTFRTKWFSKAARKALITDRQLCEAIEQVRKGQADDLGGGVYKKRLDKNRYRGIILAKGGALWVYEYLFAKKDRANIEEDELDAFRKLAAGYAVLNAQQLQQLLDDDDLMEICNDGQAQVQE
ncbi:MAG: hypothetical protein QOK17_1379 [Sphingomonadales bacterium]|jgi:hypothetical protein|nr:hypothetical protein [Sphingomonadales bacterium]